VIKEVEPEDTMIVLPRKVLSEALKEDFDQIVVIGKKDEDFYVASSHPYDDMIELIDDGIDAVDQDDLDWDEDAE
jgi:hypothetical protein